MDLPVEANVYCQNGFVGKTETLIINPIKKTVTHFVISTKLFRNKSYLAPLSLIEATTAKRIDLACDLEDLEKLEPFQDIRFVEVQDAGDLDLEAWDVMAWPFAELVKEDSFFLDKVPLGELSLRRGCTVKTLDGAKFVLEEFVIDHNSGMITHLVIRQRDGLEVQEVYIPVHHIKNLEDKVIQLGITQHVLDQLLHVRVRRNFKVKKAKHEVV